MAVDKSKLNKAETILLWDEEKKVAARMARLNVENSAKAGKNINYEDEYSRILYSRAQRFAQGNQAAAQLVAEQDPILRRALNQGFIKSPATSFTPGQNRIISLRAVSEGQVGLSERGQQLHKIINDGGIYELTQAQIEELNALYPNVDFSGTKLSEASYLATLGVLPSDLNDAIKANDSLTSGEKDYLENLSNISGIIQTEYPDLISDSGASQLEIEVTQAPPTFSPESYAPQPRSVNFRSNGKTLDPLISRGKEKAADIAKSTMQTGAKNATQKLGIEGAKNVGKGFGKKFGGSAISAGISKIAGVVGGAITGGLSLLLSLPALYKFLRNNKENIINGAGALLALGGLAIAAIGGLMMIAIAAFLSSLVLPLVIVFVIIPLFIALSMYIINNSAWVVPLGGDASFLNTGIVASGTCPLTGEYIITSPSYNPADETGHGSNSYWGTEASACRYNIPINTQFSGCNGPSSSVPNSSDNYCSGQEDTCPYYGYAVDVQPTGANNTSRPVVLPYLCNPGSGVSECAPLNWSVFLGFFNCAGSSKKTPGACNGEHWGYGIVFTAEGNGHTYQLLINHIDPLQILLNGDGSIKDGGSFQSGDQIGIATTDLLPGTHIHLELNIDGTPVVPDFMCGGEISEVVCSNKSYLPGNTAMGNQIPVCKFVNPNSGEPDKALVVVSGIHTTGGVDGGDEGDGTYHIAQGLIQYFEANKDEVPEGIELSIVPTLNADVLNFGAYQAALQNAPNYDFWRNSGKIGRSNANGVDLNRNWDYRWSADTELNSGLCPGCGGSGPLSEPETVALSRYLSQLRMSYGVVTLHSRAGFVVLDSEKEVAINDEFGRAIAGGMGYSTNIFSTVAEYSVFGDLMGRIALDHSNPGESCLGDPDIYGDGTCNWITNTVAADIEYSNHTYEGAALDQIVNQTVSGIKSGFNFLNNNY